MTTNDSVWLTDELGVATDLKEEIELSSASETRVLISGPAGIDLDRVAQLIHRRSPRSERPFVAVRCGDLPATRLQSALEQADEGTVFLDEIGALSERLQADLVRFLESATLGRPTSGRRLNVRIIAASTGELWRNVSGGGFRADLYYRLNVIHIVVPLPAAQHRPA